MYRAYRTGKIPGAQLGRNIRFDLDEVHRVMRERAEAMSNSQCTKRATGGASRRRAAQQSPRSVTRGCIPQRSFQEVDSVDEFPVYPHY